MPLLVFLDFFPFLRSVRRRRPPVNGIGGFEFGIGVGFEFDGGETPTIGFKPFLDTVVELAELFELVGLVELVELLAPICLYFNA